jgi:uncharacterized protein YggE
MSRIHTRTVLTLILFTAAQIVPAALAQIPSTGGRHVTVSGNGVVHVVPDQATIRFGVVTTDLEPEQARAENSDVSAATLNALRELEIDERKIQVNVLRIQPYFEFDPDLRRNVDKGFQAVREMTVDVENLDLLPVVIAGIVGEGANRINGISYGLKDETGPEHDALILALRDARQKAQLMAETLDTRLGVVLQISEQGIVRPQPIMMFDERVVGMKDASAAANPDAYASGEIDVVANVTVVFGLLPSRVR